MPVKPILIVVDNAPIDPEDNEAFSDSLDFLRDTYHVLIIHRTDAGDNFFKVMDDSEMDPDDEAALNTILGI